MNSTPLAAVFDCNVYVQTLLSTRGAAYGCWEKAVGGQVRLYASAYVIAEIRRLPDDAHYVNLAVATGAMLVVSNDKDLLDLMSEGNSDGTALRSRYPTFRVISPAQMLALVRS